MRITFTEAQIAITALRVAAVEYGKDAALFQTHAKRALDGELQESSPEGFLRLANQFATQAEDANRLADTLEQNA